MFAVIRELRQAARRLARSPGYSVLAVITLALGAGASTAIFGAVYRELLHPLPFPDSERLMSLRLSSAWAGGEAQESDWSYPLLAGLARRGRGFDRLAFYGALDGNLVGSGEPERIQIEVVSPSYLPLLGVDAILGRRLAAEDDAGGGRPVALIGHGLWQRRFAGDPAVLGTVIRLDRTALTVIGVLPPEFRGLSGSAEVWAPLALSPALYYQHALAEPWNFWLRAVGRTAPGVTPAAAERETAALVPRIAAEHPLPMAAVVAWAATARPLQEARTRPELRRALLLLLGASSFVVLIAGANLAALTLVRVQARGHESAVRIALGCSRFGLAGQTLAETLLLALGGGLAGLLVYGLLDGAVEGLDPGALIARTGAPTEWFAPPAGAGLLVVAFDFGLATLAGTLFGAVPALRASRLDPVIALRQTPGGTAGCRPRGRVVLAVAEVALAVMLLFGAGWMLHSFARLVRVDRGFSASERVLTFWIEPSRGEYAAGEEAASLQRDLIDRLRGLPSVEAVSVDKCSPLSGECPSTVVTYLEGRPFSLDAAPQVELHYVGPDHFRLLGVPVLAGRPFSSRDIAGAPRVVLLNRAAAHRLYGTEQAIGRRLALANGLFRDEGTAQVVGVVDDVRYGPPADPVEPAVYLSALQYSFPSTQVLVRAAGDPLALAAAARRAVQEVDPGLPIFEIRTLAERIRLAFAQPRTGTLLLTFFALLALVLAALGVYGLIAYSTARRVRELGIRIALGAGRGQVAALVVGNALSIVAAGLVLGTLGAFALGRLFASMLYDVAPGDPVTSVVVAVLLTATAVLAACLPARRALRIDPVPVLRQD